MRFPPFLPPPDGLVLQAVNALLRREDWARHRLAGHAGQSLRLTIGRMGSFRAAITADGLLQSCDAAIVPDVQVSIAQDRLSELPAAWRARGMKGVVGLARIEGDAGLAQQVSDLAAGLRWDVEDDLSRLVGDILAVRLIQCGRGLARELGHAGQRAEQNIAEYLRQESGLAVSRPDFVAWGSDVDGLRERLDRLNDRLARLEAAC